MILARSSRLSATLQPRRDHEWRSLIGKQNIREQLNAQPQKRAPSLPHVKEKDPPSCDNKVGAISPGRRQRRYKVGLTPAKCERPQREQSDYVAERQIISATDHYWPRGKRCYVIQGPPGQQYAKTLSPLDVVNEQFGKRIGPHGAKRRNTCLVLGHALGSSSQVTHVATQRAWAWNGEMTRHII